MDMSDILGVAETTMGRNSHYARMNNAASQVWCCQGDFNARLEGEADFEFAYIQACKEHDNFRKACNELDGALDSRKSSLLAIAY